MAGSPLIFNGRRAKMLTQDGILRSDGSIIDNNGVPNLIKNGHAEINVTGWTVSKNTVAASRPDSGFVTSSTNITWTRNTTNPIDGQADFLYTKDAANRRGEQVYCGFTVAKKHRAKVLQIEVDYLVNSGTFSAGSSSTDSDVILYIYDVTNSTFIEPSSFKFLSNSSTIADKFIANFQTSATGSSYRILFHQATTSTSAFAVQFKDVSIKPCQYVYGTPISDWVDYMPTFTGLGTPTISLSRWRRVGSNSEIDIRATAGTVTGSNATFTLPSGQTVDYSNFSTIVGYANTQSTTYPNPSVIWENGNSTNILSLANGNAATSGFTQLTGTNVGNATILSLKASVKISGWSSSTQVSDGYDGRQIVFVGKNSAATSIATTGTYVPFTSQKDSTASWSTDTFTCPSFGDYEVKAGLHGSSPSNYLYAQVDKSGTLYARILQNESRGDRLASGSVIVYNCSAGETIKLKAYSDASSQTLNTSADLNFITISKLSSPQTISATERVSGLRNSTSGQSISSNTETTIQYANSEEDTHGMWSTSTHDWTVPVAGRYSVNGFLRTTGAETVTAGQIFRVKLYVDGSYAKEVSFIRYLNTVAGSEQAANFSGELKLNAGQKVSIVLLSTVACTLSNAAGVNWAAIRLIK